MKKRTELLNPGEIIPLNFDFVFEGIFTNPDNMVIIENFVSCFLEIDLNDVKGHLKILNRDLVLDSKRERNKQVDLLFDFKGEKINIELNNRYSKGIKERNLVYLSSIHGRQLKYGDNKYNNIEKNNPNKFK